MRVQDYFNSIIGKRIYCDGQCGYQCVGTFKHYCNTVGIGAYLTKNNNASGYYYYANEHANEFDVIHGAENFRNGDWVIWGIGSSHPDSHIAMYYNGNQVSQNQTGPEVTSDPCDTWGDALGALRPKGDYEWDDYKKPEIEEKENAVYRFHNIRTGDYFYTANFNEAKNVNEIYEDYQYEGIGFYQGGDVPVYRLYGNNKSHFYTAYACERDELLASGNWIDEGIGFYSKESGTPIYRLYSGVHLFTPSYNEVTSAIRLGTWVLEGIGWYE